MGNGRNLVGEPKTVREPKTKTPRKPAAQRALRNYESPIAQRIVEVALPQFADRGFNNVTMREIAKETGLELPSIYYQFRDKRELYLKCWEQVVINGNEGPRRALTADAPAVVRIFNFWVAVAENTLRQPHLNKFIMRLLLEEDREGLHLIDENAMHDIFERFILTVEEATARPATMRDLVAGYSLSLCMCHFSALGGRMEQDLNGTVGSPEALASFVMRAIYPEIAQRLN